MRFKRLERVEILLLDYSDFGKIVKLYPKTKKYLIIPDGADQHWLVKESYLRRIKCQNKS